MTFQTALETAQTDLLGYASGFMLIAVPVTLAWIGVRAVKRYLAML